MADLNALSAVVLLAEDYGARLQDAEAQLRAARQGQDETRADLARIAERIAAFRIPQALLAAEETISALFQEKSVIQKSKRNRERRVAEAAELNRQLTEQSQRLRPGLSLEDAANLEPGQLARARIKELSPEAPRLETRCEELSRSLDESRRKVADCDAALATLEAPSDTTALTAIVNRGRRELDPARGRDLRENRLRGEGAGTRRAVRVDEHAKALAEASKQAASVRERWMAVRAGCGIAPESPAAMLTWLRRRSGIVEQAARLREMRVEVRALEDAEAALADQLAAALAQFGIRAMGSAPDLLEIAEGALTAAAASAEKRRTALKVRESQAAEIARIETNLAEAKLALEAWRGQWQSALTDAGLNTAASPVAAEAYLATVREICAGADKLRHLNGRIGAMQADAARFAGSVATLTEDLDPTLRGLEPEIAIVQLNRALLEARENKRLLRQEVDRQSETPR
ncbi:MAG: hypothetical protein LAQ30_12965 [Acidobacteriia bacterium]|nr:hypothetical protein [Terriglobia bacterium]